MIDKNARTVTVGAGVTYGELAPYIDGNGYALHNLASLPHISVAGACTTGTHGSGNKNGNLSTAVSGMEIVTADGEVKTLSRQLAGERFQGAVVSLGGMGVVTKMTLDIQRTFQVSQVVYENLSMDVLEHHLDEIFGSAYSVSLFTDWQNHGLVRCGSSVAWNRDHRPNLRPNCLGQSWRLRSCIRFRDTRRNPARNSWAFRGLGTSGCRTSR